MLEDFKYLVFKKCKYFVYCNENVNFKQVLEKLFN